MNRPLLLLTVLAAALLATPAGAEVPGFVRLDVGLPGDLDETVVVTLASGEKRLALLVDPPEPEAEDEDEDGEDEENRDDGPNPETGPADEEDGEGAPAAGRTAEEDENGAQRPRTLLLVDPIRGRTVTVADDLPREVRELGVLARSDGGREGGDLLLLGSHHGLRVVDPSADRPLAPEPTLERPGLSLRAVRGGRVDGFADATSAGSVPGRAPEILALARPGRLELLSAGPAGGLESAAELPLPKRAERTSWGVRLTSPPVHRLPAPHPGADAPESGCWAVGPELFGERRVRSLLRCADGADGAAAGPEAAEPVEAWSLLPEGETITESRYAFVLGRPVLAVLTRHKIGPFVKQRLRLFDLEASRNRVGSEPVLAAQTGCPIWRPSTVGFPDVDGDGVEDLALVCVKGLVDQELRVEVYAGVEDGRGGVRFDARVRDVELDGEYGGWHAGEDWTGDGRADLLALHDGELDLHAGTGGRRPIERSPVGRIDLGDGAAGELTVEVEAGPGGEDEVTIRAGGGRILGVADLNGDGRPEIVVRRDGRRGDVLTILSPR